MSKTYLKQLQDLRLEILHLAPDPFRGWLLDIAFGGELDKAATSIFRFICEHAMEYAALIPEQYRDEEKLRLDCPLCHAKTQQYDMLKGSVQGFTVEGLNRHLSGRYGLKLCVMLKEAWNYYRIEEEKP